MITVSAIIRLSLVLLGGLFLVRSVLSLAKRNMTESFCVFWNILSVLMIFAGIVLNPSGLDSMVSREGVILTLVAVVAILEVAYYLTKSISKVVRQNRELTLQVALMQYQIKALEKKHAETDGETDVAEDLICDQHHGLRGSGNSAAQSA